MPITTADSIWDQLGITFYSRWRRLHLARQGDYNEFPSANCAGCVTVLTSTSRLLRRPHHCRGHARRRCPIQQVEHGMNDWAQGTQPARPSTLVIRRECAGKRVYVIAATLTTIRPTFFQTLWFEYYSMTMLPGWIIGFCRWLIVMLCPREQTKTPRPISMGS